MKKTKYIKNIDEVTELGYIERSRMGKVVQTYAFRSNDYYQSLIDWDDPNDPIRKIVIPDVMELDDWGKLDPSDESEYTVLPGLQHKYPGTALLLINDVCGAYCRFCFRKRLFMNENEEVTRDVTDAIEYIQQHEEINNVLLTGGDPLILSTGKLRAVISQLREIDHVQIIRIGTKMPAFNPYRILNGPTLLEMFRAYSTKEKRIYMMTQFNHPREITPQAIEALDMIQKAGVIVANQTPLLRGINDDPDVLEELFNRLSYIGVPTYYIFQVRPTMGNRIYCLPIEESLDIFETAISRCSGLAKRARLVMSHATGKLEIVGKTSDQIFFRYHRSPDPDNDTGLFALNRNPDAYWLDDYEEVSEEYAFETANDWEERD